MAKQEINHTTVVYEDSTYKRELGEKIWVTYPYIGGNNPDQLRNYMNKKLPFCSFDALMEDSVLLRSILLIALKRSKNPNDDAFCVHGSNKHSNFNRALKELTQSIVSGDFTFERHVGTADIKNKQIPDTRFVLRSPTGALAVFLDLQSVAHSLVNPNWNWRPRNKYIYQRYGNFSTTRMLSAYIKGNR